MKFKILPVIAALLFTIGCASTPQQQINQLAADARDIGEFGTRVALLENANFRKELDYTVLGLKELELLPDPLTVDALVNVLARLPVKELQTEKAQLFILGGKVIIRRAAGNVQLGTLGIRPIVEALRAGMEAGLLK